MNILLFALLTGIVADVFLRGGGGFGFTMTIIFGISAFYAVALRTPGYKMTADTHAFALAGFFFALTLSIRASEPLQALNMLAIIVAAVLVAQPAITKSVRKGGIFWSCWAFLVTGTSVAFAPIWTLASDISWPGVTKGKVPNQVLKFALGLAIGIPLVMIVGALLVSADKSFEKFVSGLINIDELFGHLVLTGVFAWITTGYLRVSTVGAKTSAFPKANLADPEAISDAAHGLNVVVPKEDFEAISRFRLGLTEISVVLVLLSVVLGAFVVFQIPYLFGGMELVQNTPGVKLAEYARRGVGELMNVSLIVLTVLIASRALLRRESAKTVLAYRIISAILVGLLFVVMASATQRVLLLTGSLGYGLTGFRFNAVFLLIWLTMVYSWFLITEFTSKPHRFLYGAVWSGFLVIAAINVINPDDFIARRNIALYEAGRPFDFNYHSTLSADATEALIEGGLRQKALGKNTMLESVPGNCTLDNDFRGWNLARENARKLKIRYGLCGGGR